MRKRINIEEIEQRSLQEADNQEVDPKLLAIQQSEKRRLEMKEKFEKTFRSRPGFGGFSESSAKYAEKLHKKWKNASDPSNTGEHWKLQKVGPGGRKAQRN